MYYYFYVKSSISVGWFKDGSKSALFELVPCLILPVFLILLLYVLAVFQSPAIDVSKIVSASSRHLSAPSVN